MRVRLGVVSYLNSRPLVEMLRTGAIDRDFELIYGVPSRCAERLHMGETDVALIPAAEIGRGRDPYRIVPNIGIISNGPVGSVFIVLNKKPKKFKHWLWTADRAHQSCWRRSYWRDNLAANQKCFFIPQI